MALGLSCSEACGIFPDQGSNPCLLLWQTDSLPWSRPGSPEEGNLIINTDGALLFFKISFPHITFFLVDELYFHFYSVQKIFFPFFFFFRSYGRQDLSSSNKY